MPRGRPRKSLADHIRDGTYRRDRHGPLPGENAASEVAPRGESAPGKLNGPVAPVVAIAELSATETELLQRLTALLGTTLTERDAPMLNDLCWWWIELHRIQQQLKSMKPGEKGYKDTLTAAGIAQDKVDKIGTKFGLTPADRAKLGVVATGPVVAKVPVRGKTKLDQQGPPTKQE